MLSAMWMNAKMFGVALFRECMCKITQAKLNNKSVNVITGMNVNLWQLELGQIAIL